MRVLYVALPLYAPPPPRRRKRTSLCKRAAARPRGVLGRLHPSACLAGGRRGRGGAGGRPPPTQHRGTRAPPHARSRRRPSPTAATTAPTLRQPCGDAACGGRLPDRRVPLSTFSRGRGRLPTAPHRPLPPAPLWIRLGRDDGRGALLATPRGKWVRGPPARSATTRSPRPEPSDRGSPGRRRGRGTRATRAAAPPTRPPGPQSTPCHRRWRRPARAGRRLSATAASRRRAWPHWLSRTRARRVRCTPPEHLGATRARLFVYVGPPAGRRPTRHAPRDC